MVRPTPTPHLDLHVAVHERHDPAAREALLEEYRPNAIALATRLHRGREPLEDLIQVALEALLLAIDRFDPHRGLPFIAYATPTIVGTIKRHYRDQGWAMRVPRRVHELAGPIAHATALLEQDLGRTPTSDEVADLLGVPASQVEEVQVTTGARATRSLDLGGRDDEDERPIEPGAVDPAYRGVEDREALRRAVATLGDREREVVHLYFEAGLTQAAIGKRVGCSQMQVSRVLNRSLDRLRDVLTDAST